MDCTVRFGNCFLSATLMYQPCCLVPCCQGELGELTKKQFTKPTAQLILSLSAYQRSIAALSAEEVMSFSALVSGKEDISA